MLITITVLHNLDIHQMDVKTVFLNGNLNEEINMDQPQGFIVKGQEHKMCKLVKSLYSLKQAPKQQHEKFDSVMIKDGLTINECDKCVYTKTVGNACIIVCLYVDDMYLGLILKLLSSLKEYYPTVLT